MKPEQLIELRHIDNGTIRILTYRDCIEIFGEEFFKEILLGYASHWKARLTDEA